MLSKLRLQHRNGMWFTVGSRDFRNGRKRVNRPNCLSDGERWNDWLTGLLTRQRPRRPVRSLLRDG